MKLYHLSHIDLDGYGCQFLTDLVFEEKAFYNANYGPEVKARLQQMVDDINSQEKEDILFMVTDLNLSPKECSYLENECTKSSKNISLQLLDHHITGSDSAQKHDWYHLDVSKSATKITYDYLNKNYKDISGYKQLVKAINAIDIWLMEDSLFEFGKVCMGMIEGAREFNKIVFPQEDRAYKFYLIAQAFEYIDKGAIALDEACFFIKKRYFVKENDDILDNLIAKSVVELMSAHKERMSVMYKGYRGFVGYGIGKSSVIGNAFLVANPEYNFYMDVSFRGKVSLRGNSSADVSRIASELFGGGGHKNASGGKIEKFKESFVYDDIKAQIEDIMTHKS
ncbi:MAG: DHH family phosphoesterase [Campylobacterota bacterium]